MGRPPERALFRRELKKAFRARHGRRFPPLHCSHPQKICALQTFFLGSVAFQGRLRWKNYEQGFGEIKSTWNLELEKEG